MKKIFFVYAVLFLLGSAAPMGYAQGVPNWLPGSYYTYDGYSRTDCYLRVTRDGGATLNISQNGSFIRRKSGRYYPNNRMILSGEHYTIYRNGNGVTLNYVSGNHRSWAFRRQ